MKKLFFAVLAAFMVSLSFTSCSSSPEKQMMGYMEDMVSLLKDTHIKSADDVKAFAEKAKSIQEKVEKLQESVGKDYESKLSEEEQKEMEKQMEELTSQIFPELQRIQKEAQEAGLSEEDLKALNDAF